MYKVVLYMCVIKPLPCHYQRKGVGLFSITTTHIHTSHPCKKNYLKKANQMKKLISKAITLSVGNVGTVPHQVSFDNSIKEIVGVSLYETSNVSNNDYKVGLSVNGNTIIDPATRLSLLVSSSVEPNKRARELNIPKTAQNYDLNVVMDVAIATNEVKFTAVFECETFE